MASSANVEEQDVVDRGHPSTWTKVIETMNGFPFPELSSCRELMERAPVGLGLFIVLPGGTTYYLLRHMVNSLFGGVFHGVQGFCTDTTNAGTYRAPEQGRQNHVAIKRSELAQMSRTQEENVFREISVMRYLSQGTGHPYVMPLVGACMTRTHVYVVTPFYGGGDLLRKVVPDVGIEERIVRRWFRQILLGVGYIHNKGLCHHDLSPENIVITGSGDAAVVMDLGMVQRMPVGRDGNPVPMRDHQRFGKLRYMSPEIYNNQDYDGRQSDIWSVGVSLLVCLMGDYPWAAPTRLTVPERNIFSTDISHYRIFVQRGAEVMLQRMNLMPPRICPEAVEFVCAILTIDRDARPRSADLLAGHPFFLE